MSFPTLVYKCPGVHHGPGSSTYSYMGVLDAEQLASARADGWFLTLSEALAGEEAEEEDDSMPDREELELKANELGIKFDGRTTDAALMRKIESATGGGE